MTKYKNKSFTVFGTKYKLIFKDNVKDKDGNPLYGVTDFKNFVVHISTKNPDGNPYSDEVILNTIMHELMHVIFGEGAYHSCNEDEPLVEWSAKCLVSFMKQKLI